MSLEDALVLLLLTNVYTILTCLLQARVSAVGPRGGWQAGGWCTTLLKLGQQTSTAINVCFVLAIPWSPLVNVCTHQTRIRHTRFWRQSKTSETCITRIKCMGQCTCNLLNMILIPTRTSPINASEFSVLPRILCCHRELTFLISCCC